MKIVRRLFHDPQTALFSIFLGLFSLGQLQRIQLTQQIAFYLHDLVIIIFLMINLFKIKNKLNLKKINLFLKKIKKKYALELAWIIWLTGGILAGWLAQRFTLQSSLYLIRIIVYASFVFSLLKLQFFYSKQNYQKKKDIRGFALIPNFLLTLSMNRSAGNRRDAFAVDS